jgi:hypothetical protein
VRPESKARVLSIRTRGLRVTARILECARVAIYKPGGFGNERNHALAHEGIRRERICQFAATKCSVCNRAPQEPPLWASGARAEVSLVHHSTFELSAIWGNCSAIRLRARSRQEHGTVQPVSADARRRTVTERNHALGVRLHHCVSIGLASKLRCYLRRMNGAPKGHIPAPIRRTQEGPHRGQLLRSL